MANPLGFLDNILRSIRLNSSLNETEPAKEEDVVSDVVNDDILSGGIINNNNVSLASGNQKNQNNILASMSTQPTGSLSEWDGSTTHNIGKWFSNALGLPSNTEAQDTMYGELNKLSNVKKSDEDIRRTVGGSGFNIDNYDFANIGTGTNTNIEISTPEIEEAKKEQEEGDDSDNILSYWKYLAFPTTYGPYKLAEYGTKKTEELITGEAGWAQGVRMGMYGALIQGAEHIDDTQLKRQYESDIADMVGYSIMLDNGEITPYQYNATLEKMKRKYAEAIGSGDKNYSFFAQAFSDGSNPDSGYGGDIIESDISSYRAYYAAAEKRAKLDPVWKGEEDAKTAQINASISVIMQQMTQNAKYMGDHGQEFVTDVYNSMSDWATKAVNGMAPARRVKTQLIAEYGTEDTTNYSVEDKAIMDNIHRLENIYELFVRNYANRVSKYPLYANPSSGRLEELPEVIDGMNLHDAVFQGVDELLTEEDLDGLWIPMSHISSTDVIGAIASDIANDYSNSKYGWMPTWTNVQHTFRPLGPMIQEGGQVTVGQGYVWLYNNLSKKSGELSYDALNEDNLLLSTLTTNNSRFGQLMQEYTSKTMEVLPEITAEVLATWKLANLPDKIFKAAQFRLLMNNGFWNTVKGLSKVAKLKNVSRLEAATELINTGKIVTTLSDGTEEVLMQLPKISEIGSWGKLAQYLKRDLVPNALWDQVIDASLSSADTDFGSDVSMVFSLGGTVLGNVIARLGELGLWQMGKNGINMIKDSKLDSGAIKRTIIDGTTWDFIRYMEDSDIDNYVKAKLGMSTSLATWDELRRLTPTFRKVEDGVRTALNALSPSERQAITQATKKGLHEMMKPLINQVYGGNSPFALRIAQLAADGRTNPADLVKYIMGLNGDVSVWGWKSRISVPGMSDRLVHSYNENLDILFSDGGFGRRLKEGFTNADIQKLKDAGYGWAEEKNFKKIGDNQYSLTKEGLERAGNDIVSSSLDVVALAKTTETAEEFDSLMKKATFRKISDKTLQDIRDSGAYDTLADALGEIAWLCEVKVG